MHRATLVKLATAASLALGNALASDQVDDALAELTQPESKVSVGMGYWSGDREEFGMFDGIRDSETVWLLDADIKRRNEEEGSWFTFKVEDLGLDKRKFDIGYERQGDWGVGLDYGEMVRVDPYTINTSITGVGTETQTVPSTIAPATGANIKLGTRREKIGLNFFKYLSSNLSFHVDIKNEKKTGDRHWGYRTSSGGQVNFLAEPIDSTTRQLDTKLNYADRQFQLTGGYYGSLYGTDNSLLTATNIDTGTTDYLSSPLDNQAHQLYLNGGYSFTPTTRGTFRLSYTHATMDERLPTDGILGLANPAAPNSINGEVNTSLVFLGLTTRPIKNLSLVTNLRYHEVDDQTPISLIVPGEPVHVKPNGYKTVTAKLEGTYRLPDGYSLIAGIDQRNQDRTRPLNLDDEQIVPARTDIDETTYRIQLRKSLSENLNGSLAFMRSERDGSNYEAADNPEENVLNPINIADRDRNKVRLSLDWVPTYDLGLQFNYEYSRDEYGPGSNPNGLTDGRAMLLSVDADYAFNKDWNLVAWASWDETEASERVTDFGASFAIIEFERESDLKDTGTSLGLGLKGRASLKLKLGANLEWTRTKSQYDDNDDPGISGSDIPLPNVKSTVAKLALFAEYELEKKTELRFDLVHQNWRSNDWSWEFSDRTDFSYGTSSDGTLVIADPNQSSTFVGVSYIHRF
ncbi:MAG: MtrB/PioB family decaheme-associated outer membrane protein [Cycloclasticus sp.]|jgi:MtrB/PioB family decaheme-associated outer membrane protein